MAATRLCLFLHSGFHLPKADLLGTIDSFCVIHLPLVGGEVKQFKTQVIMNNPHPDWDYQVACNNVDATKDILIEVWDHDLMGKELCCQLKMSIQELVGEGLWIRKKYILECLGKFKPYKKSKECSISISASTRLAESDGMKIHWFDLEKKVVVYKLMGLLDDKLYLRVKYGVGVKLTILDAHTKKDMILFESTDGRAISNIISEWDHNFTKEKYNVRYCQKICMGECGNSLEHLNISVGNLSKKQNISLKSITKEHGFETVLPYEESKKQLKNVSFDDNNQRIYMKENDFTYMLGYNEASFDQEIWLNENTTNEGIYGEFTYTSVYQNFSFNVTSYGNSCIHNNTEMIYRYGSEINNALIESLAYFQIRLFKVKDPKSFPLPLEIFYFD